MNFLQAVNVGLEKSKKSLEARRQVDEVFNQVNCDLRGFSEGELLLERAVSFIARAASLHGVITGVESEDLEHDKLVLKLKTQAGTFTEEVAGWKQRAAGFPCILKFDGQELSCGSSQHLSEGIFELFGSIRFGSAVGRLVSKAHEAILSQATSEKSLGGDGVQKASPNESTGAGDTPTPNKNLQNDSEELEP